MQEPTHPLAPCSTPGAPSMLSQTTSNRSCTPSCVMSILADLRGKRVLILGFGREGRSTLGFLRERAVHTAIAVADRRTHAQMSVQEREALASLPSDRVVLGPDY